MKIVKTRAHKDILRGHKDTIISLISPHGTTGGMLLSASKDGQIRGWDLIQRQIVCKLLISRWPNETTVYEQNLQEDEVVLPKDKKLVKDQLCSAIFNDKNVYGGYEDGYMSSWNMKSGETLYTYEGHEGSITSMKFLNARVLCTCSIDGTIRLWDTSSGVCETIIKFGYPINAMRINGATIEILYNKNTIAEVDSVTLKLGSTIQFPNYSITSFLINNDSLIFGTVDNCIRVYSMAELNAFQNHPADGQHLPAVQHKYLIESIQGWILCMEILDKYIYIGTDEKKIRVYNLSNWVMVEEFIGHDDGITQVAFADNMLYSGAYDHSIRSWDLKEMYNRIRERVIMYREDINSKRQEVYLKALPKKKKGKKGAAKATKGKKK